MRKRVGVVCRTTSKDLLSMHHRKIWPIRERLLVGGYVTAAWVMLFVASISERHWLVLLAVAFIWHSERSYTQEWLNACERAGIDERDASGVF